MVAKAKVRIEGEDATAAAWRKAMGTAQGASKKIASMYRTAFAGVSVAAFANVGRDAIKMGDDLNKAAIKAGITGSAMSELSYVAKQSDVDLTALSAAIKKMQVNLSEAASGAKAPNQALQALGLTVRDLKGLKADKQFEIIGDRIAALPDPLDRTRASVELFGKAGNDLQPMFANGAEGIRLAREEAIALGATLTDEQIQKLADADTALKQLDASWRGFTARMVSEYAPALKHALDFWSGAPRSLAQQIADLEDQIENVTSTRGASAETWREMYRKRLAELRKMAAEESAREMGVAGTGGSSPAGPGYAGVAAAEDAAAADKARMTEAMRREEQFRESLAQTRELNEEVQKYISDTAEEGADAWNEHLDDLGSELEQLKIENPYAEMAQDAKDVLMGAWDDWVHGGEISVKKLFAYIAAEWAKRGLSKMFDNIIGSVGGSGGFLGLLGFANGGSFKVGGSGGTDSQLVAFKASPDETVSITKPGQGSGMVFAPVYNIDARGASMDLVRALPRILRDNNASLEARIVERLRRNFYPSAA